MEIFLGILKFLFSTAAIFITWVLILNIISSIINPQIVLENGNAIEKNNNARFIFALIIAVCWAIVIVLP
jgi:hypothetical protein